MATETKPMKSSVQEADSSLKISLTNLLDPNGNTLQDWQAVILQEKSVSDLCDLEKPLSELANPNWYAVPLHLGLDDPSV
jgi:hypothetical protein